MSDGGVNWTPIGATGITFDQPLHGLGLMAIGPEQEEPVVVEFDSFQLETPQADTTAPTTSLTWAPDAPDGGNGWYRTVPSFALAATDGEGSGVASTEYAIGDGAWTAYEGPVELSGQGETAVSFRSTDASGNVEATGSAVAKVDSIAATTTASVEDVVGGVQVTLTAVDDTSGVTVTEVSVDGGAWDVYAEPILVTGAGDHTVTYRSTDSAGNVEVDQAATVTVGEDPGPVELSIVANAASQCVNGNAHVAVYAINTGNVWADITLTTAWGTHTTEKVAPGAAVYHLFDTGSPKLKKGTATVAAHHWDGSTGYDVSHEPAFAKATCT